MEKKKMSFKKINYFNNANDIYNVDSSNFQSNYNINKSYFIKSGIKSMINSNSFTNNKKNSINKINVDNIGNAHKANNSDNVNNVSNANNISNVSNIINKDISFDFGKYFPYDHLREPQKKMIREIWNSIVNRRNILINAPTGIGKTAAALIPTIKYILEKDPKKKIFFLTSANSHHFNAVKTLKDIYESKNIKIITSDILGKKWMCSFSDLNKISSAEVSNYCKIMKKNGLCPYYNNTKNKKDFMTVKARSVLNKLKSISPCDNNSIITFSRDENLCPYEIAVELSKEARVVVADYYYLFDPMVQQAFLNRIGQSLGDSILIVDEAHNLIKRMRDRFTIKMSNYNVKLAIKEAKKAGFDKQAGYLIKINDILNSFIESMEKSKKEYPSFNSFNEVERLISVEELISLISEIESFDDLTAELLYVGDKIRTTEKKSYVGSIGNFLSQWPIEENGFIRIVKLRKPIFNNNEKEIISIERTCLDPSYLLSETINSCHSVIFMSATLYPIEMYLDLFGLSEENTELISFENPFPKKNRLNLIIPKTTTKFSRRSLSQYTDIAKICLEIITAANVNTIVFLPSYKLLNSISNELEKLLENNLLKINLIKEKPNLTQDEKSGILNDFMKKSKQVLLAVASGSFNEGIDLPGKALQLVIVVGLPLSTPDLKTKELINYYNQKFGKGLFYGYVYPAMTKVIQAVGRCIRTENDKGVLVFLDERYSWSMYKKCFPEDWDVVIDPINYKDKIKEFFNN